MDVGIEMGTIKEKTKRREAIIAVAGYIRCKVSRKGVWEVEVEKNDDCTGAEERRKLCVKS